jgi:hypothetical protein
MTAAEKVLQYHPDRGYSPISTVAFKEIGLDPGLSFIWEYTVTLPEPNQVSSLALAPSGSRLAWILGGLSSNRYTFWISDAHGRDFRLIGKADGISCENPHPLTGRRYDWPRHLRWLPDDKQVSFIYRDTLYTIPAD